MESEDLLENYKFIKEKKVNIFTLRLPSEHCRRDDGNAPILQGERSSE